MLKTSPAVSLLATAVAEPQRRFVTAESPETSAAPLEAAAAAAAAAAEPVHTALAAEPLSTTAVVEPLLTTVATEPLLTTVAAEPLFATLASALPGTSATLLEAAAATEAEPLQTTVVSTY